MPDNKYYLEETISQAISLGVQVNAICVQQSVCLEFAWQIAQANQLFTKTLDLMEEDDIAKSACIDKNCFIHGKVHLGENSIIREGVVIEGNCWIEDNVIVEKGAILGKNVLIRQGSKIQYGCKINDYTVIGTNNKIGYNAEIAGVTFDGVCAVHTCEVYGIIGKKVDIAGNVMCAILRFDDANVTQNIEGKRYSNTFTSYICIGDYCRTGVSNVFSPGIRIGSRSAIGPSVMIESDVPANSLILKKQELIQKSWGSNRYGW